MVAQNKFNLSRLMIIILLVKGKRENCQRNALVNGY